MVLTRLMFTEPLCTTRQTYVYTQCIPLTSKTPAITSARNTFCPDADQVVNAGPLAISVDFTKDSLRVILMWLWFLTTQLET